uniref:Uncharacterized protein n=1 Tax=Leersia perrieri TaxID=77586 RepID=A0A0D9XZ83_9ORYZ
MAAIGSGSSSWVANEEDSRSGDDDSVVAKLLWNLNLTAEEGELAEFSDDEKDDGSMSTQWVLFGKVLSPSTLHVSTILGAMKPAWGNPYGLKIRSVEREEYDKCVKPSNICFDKMDIWVRILDLPLGWMNNHRGPRAMSLIGDVIRVDVEATGKASGPFLRARVAI